MDWQEDYLALADLLTSVAAEFERATGKTEYLLDFEYKKLAPKGELVVKQVREVPRLAAEGERAPFLVNDPEEYCMVQGEIGSDSESVFTRHRLKSRWWFQTDSLWLTSESLRRTLFADVAVEYVADGEIRTCSGPLALWPGAWHSARKDAYGSDYETVDGWRLDDLGNPRRCELRIDGVPTAISPLDPVVTLRDFGHRITLYVEHADPVVSMGYWHNLLSVISDAAPLSPCLQPQNGDLLQRRAFHDKAEGSSITTTFYWPPGDAPAGYTAPLGRWVETVIEGYTSEAIVLHGYYSQTYGPTHHNFSENFLFEPRLVPGISPAILRELEAQDIRLILFYYSGALGGDSFIRTFGFEADRSSAKPTWMLFE
jgi:hypothetical protein